MNEACLDIYIRKKMECKISNQLTFAWSVNEDSHIVPVWPCLFQSQCRSSYLIETFTFAFIVDCSSKFSIIFPP